MKLSKIVTKSLFTMGLAMSFSGCATNLGQFTVASTHNVRHLDYTAKDKIEVSGSACARNLFWFLPISQQDDLLQRAMDNAIRNGQNSFLDLGKTVDGDILVNVRITYDTTTLLIYNDLCYSVTGDLVKINVK